MTTTRKTTVTHPDGTVSTRRSKTMTYTHAAQVTIDTRAAAAKYRTAAERFRALAAALAEILASGDLTRLGRQVSSVNGRGERFYSSFVQGDHPYHWLPDYRNAESWAKYIDGAVAQIAKQAEQADARADELMAGPEFTYHVYRWSKSAALAAKGADEYARHGVRGASVQVVAVDEV